MKKRTVILISSFILLLTAILSSFSSCAASEPAASTTGTEAVTAKNTGANTEKQGTAFDTIPDISVTETQPAKETEPPADSATGSGVTEAPTEPVSTDAPQTEPPATEKPDETTKAERQTKDVEPLDPEKKYVAFTFDDGPHKTNSKKITDKMLEYGGKCTFFVIGDLIKGDAEKGMVYAYEHGMEIGIHCWTHDHYYTEEPKYYHDEVYKTADKLKEVLGEWPTIMRPPGGNITESQYKSSEFTVIIWSIDTNDWRYKKNTDEKPKSKNIETIVNNCLYDSKGRFNVENGDIILMHEIYENSYDAFCIIIEELHQRGFEFVTVSELLQNPETGYKYYSANKRK